MFKNIEKTGLITGVALGLTATTILPIMKRTLLNLGIIGVRGTISLVDSTKTTVKLAKEEIEDIIAEAQFERMKNQLDKEINLLSEN
ncbi:DUF5132 domain-containing protein [Desulfosporosinus sp. BG]|uniref:DUF5132 domain-containing protein n=1 Tax=Desulfosporosinus sp. BG TaxID=1633135 RepID=UPI00083AFF11|nr:DUF5132 domain-containing protein [Desulfosporosinus sp. BG]ODA42399.1 hypothetical protein DSBG_0786 [Desulfosporosinus sp. BG]